MAPQRTFTHSQGWVLCDSMLVIETNTMGMIVNHGKYIEFVQVNEFLEVRTGDASDYLSYRIRTGNPDGDIIRTGFLAPWRVVEVIATT